MTTDDDPAATRLARSRERIATALQDRHAPTPAVLVLQWVAQRHPVALVAGAAGIGAVAVWSRPWRAAPRAAPLMAGLWPQLASLALAAVLASAAPSKRA